MFSLLRQLSLPGQLIIMIAIVVLFGGTLPVAVIQIIYTFSLLFKELLCFMLPFIIFFIVMHGVLSLKQNAPLVLLVLLGAVFISNFCVALSVYGIVSCLIPFLSGGLPEQSFVSNYVLESLFLLKLPTIVRSEYALVSALAGGVFFSFFQSMRVEQCVAQIKRWIELFLMRCFIPLLPVYIAGFLLKLRYEGMLVVLVHNYGVTFFLIVGVQIIYLGLLYFCMFDFSYKKASRAIINAMPVYLTGFGTMSSVLTIPVSIECALKNGVNRSIAQIAMPIMANIHLLGDSVCTPVLALVTGYLFFGYVPDFSIYVTFVCYFCTALFAVSGIPGGGILVMIPILVSMFRFTPEMISVVTTIYFLMDSFGTASNVMGDGALVKGVDNFVQRYINEN